MLFLWLLPSHGVDLWAVFVLYTVEGVCNRLCLEEMVGSTYYDGGSPPLFPAGPVGCMEEPVVETWKTGILFMRFLCNYRETHGRSHRGDPATKGPKPFYVTIAMHFDSGRCHYHRHGRTWNRGENTYVLRKMDL